MNTGGKGSTGTGLVETSSSASRAEVDKARTAGREILELLRSDRPGCTVALHVQVLRFANEPSVRTDERADLLARAVILERNLQQMFVESFYRPPRPSIAYIQTGRSLRRKLSK